MNTSTKSQGHGLHVSGLALAALTFTFAACAKDTVRYGPVMDDLAMTAIASTWSQPGGLTLSLCEALALSEAWLGPDRCQVDHVVRGGGRGLAHTERPGGGCGGGCPYRILAYVRGTASGAGLEGEVPVSGTVELQSGNTDDPYAFPYTLRLICGEGCTLEGTLGADGQVTATLSTGTSGAGGTSYRLSRTGPAMCP
jgi:hypothetical protein